MQIRCGVPARPFPTKPDGEGRLHAQSSHRRFPISAAGSKKPVPSEVNATRGGTDGDTQEEWGTL
jgi:hypothetical protein